MKQYGPTPWAAVSTLFGVSVDVPKALCPLTTFSWDFVNFPIDNSVRIDLKMYRSLDWLNKPQYLPPVLPFDEVNIYRWNTNPFELSPTHGGLSETDPGAFLFAFWIARHVFG